MGPIAMARKTTQKTAEFSAKSSAGKTKRIKKQVESTNFVEESKARGASVKLHKSTVIIAVVIVVLGVLLYFGRGFVVAAVVNGQPISRLTLIQETERQSGRQALAALIRNILVEQEAEKEKVVVGDKEIDEQIKTVEDNLSKQGQNIDQMLSLEGMSRDDLRRIIKLDLLVTKMVGKDIKITDEDVDKYIEENKDILPKDQNEDQLKETARERLKQEMLPQRAQTWLADLEKNAKVVKFVNY
jgi:hypothetical protein